MSEFTREGLEPLSTIGNDTPRIDAIERVTGRPSTPVIGNYLACFMRKFCAARTLMHV